MHVQCHNVAIEDALPASNGLTEVFCAPGYAICYFETILYASFFTETAQIAGSGVADLQFGGQESEISVSPRAAIGKRRTLRSLQEPETSSAAETAFDLELDVQQGTITGFGDSSDAVQRGMLVFYLLGLVGGLCLLVQ